MKLFFQFLLHVGFLLLCIWYCWF